MWSGASDELPRRSEEERTRAIQCAPERRGSVLEERKCDDDDEDRAKGFLFGRRIVTYEQR